MITQSRWFSQSAYANTNSCKAEWTIN